MALRFQFQSPLGDGAHADVWRVRDGKLGRDVAIKAFRPAEPSKEMRRLVLKHARALTAVRHPNIVQVFETVRVRLPKQSERWEAIVMELVEGVTLRKRLEGAPLALVEARRIGEALIDAIGHMHGNQRSHFDLAANNIMVTPEGAKVIDLYGTSRRRTADLPLEDRIAHDRRALRRHLISICERVAPPVPLSMMSDLSRCPTADEARAAFRATITAWGSPEQAQRFSEAELLPLVRSDAPARLERALDTLEYMANNEIPLSKAVEDRLVDIALDRTRPPKLRARFIARVRMFRKADRIRKKFTAEWLAAADMDEYLSWEGYALYDIDFPDQFIVLLRELERLPDAARANATMVDALGAIRRHLRGGQLGDDMHGRAAALAKRFIGFPRVEAVVLDILALSGAR